MKDFEVWWAEQMNLAQVSNKWICGWFDCYQHRKMKLTARVQILVTAVMFPSP